MRVVVVDFDMSISSMVGLMLKAVIASIPAAIILAFVAVALTFFGTVFLRALSGVQ